MYEAIYAMADGSVVTSCGVYYGQTSSSGFSMWRSGSGGATTGACVVRVDLNGSFTAGSNMAFANGIATYHDTSGDDGKTATLACSQIP